jgi:hypothetical protein
MIGAVTLSSDSRLPTRHPPDQTVPYGTDHVLAGSQAVNCLATISQSLRDMDYGANFGNSFLHCSEMIGYSHFLAWNALMTPRSQRIKPPSSKTQASRK